MKFGKLHILHLDRIVFIAISLPFLLYTGYLTIYSAYMEEGLGIGLFVGAFLLSIFWIVVPIAWEIFRGGWYYED